MGAREELWEKPDAFSTMTGTYQYIRQLSELRRRLPALPFWRIFAGMEVLVVANTSPSGRFDDHVLVDTVINSGKNASMKMGTSNPGTPSYRCALTRSYVVSWENGVRGDSLHATHMQVNLAPMELQIFTQVV